MSIPSPADLKQAATTQQAVAGTAATPPQAVATAATGTAAKPQQMSKPTVVSEPEQVRRKGKKRMRVAAAA